MRRGPNEDVKEGLQIVWIEVYRLGFVISRSSSSMNGKVFVRWCMKPLSQCVAFLFFVCLALSVQLYKLKSQVILRNISFHPSIR